MAYICPFCGDDSYKTLKKGGKTRCCGLEVVRVNGAIYANRNDAPEWRIIDEFVADKRRYHKLEHFVIKFGSSSYRNMALPAAKELLAKCGQDLELALKVVEISFTDDSHRRRKLANMFTLTSTYYFPDALAKAMRAMENDDREEEVEDYYATAPTLFA
jgi:hypothetical protein